MEKGTFTLYLLITQKNICNLIGWQEYNIGRICTLFSIFVLFDQIRKNKKYIPKKR